MSDSANNNNDGTHTSMPYQAIIVLCLVGAGALILCSWALFRHFYEDAPSPPSGDTVGEDGYTQAQYMRMVRLRNHEELQQKYGHINSYPYRQKMAQSSVFSV
ncbi:hypothetical protein HII31_11030 [Pseudocercospora fuligena]|uniref:Uncharacterized protein n=1 Tax=Pseudocercospora fuligena TaxID=685502 RepID=A0A8H6RAS9_9PEZI|nr:hypothetical protein HII31_11030 [Pseudocercospora fuligena]